VKRIEICHVYVVNPTHHGLGEWENEGGDKVAQNALYTHVELLQ
jgi:hypothetical protein